MGKKFASIITRLKGLRRSHYYCDDSWYSCPKHPEGCANDAQGDECNCGADAHNVVLDSVIANLRELESSCAS